MQYILNTQFTFADEYLSHWMYRVRGDEKDG